MLDRTRNPVLPEMTANQLGIDPKGPFKLAFIRSHPDASDDQEWNQELGVFGTPTLVFADGGSAYVRLAEAPPAADAARIFDSLVAVAAHEPRILEIKRPVKPTPA